ncbi:MAG: polysaccharide deacetylase family protein [Planctomycetota bacterium]
MIAALPLSIGGAGALYLSPALLKRRAIARLRKACVRHGALCLTYDDGPGPGVTEALLELLGAFDARATFYAPGRRLEPHRAAAERTVARGHELASHGYGHLHAWKSAPWALGADLERGARAVRDVAGPDAVGFRPPYGKLVLPTLLRARGLGLRVDWWTDDSGDSFAELPETSPALGLLDRGGGVALLHDLDRSEPRNRFVLETTRALLEGARERGLRTWTMAELAAAEAS